MTGAALRGLEACFQGHSCVRLRRSALASLDVGKADSETEAMSGGVLKLTEPADKYAHDPCEALQECNGSPAFWQSECGATGLRGACGRCRETELKEDDRAIKSPMEGLTGS